MSSCGSDKTLCCSQEKKCCGSNKSSDNNDKSTLDCFVSNEEMLRNAVREHYSKIIALSDQKLGDCCSGGSCFGVNKSEDYAKQLGYTTEDIAALPEGANIGQGCGNPLAIAQLKAGEVVLDLGSGAGFDAFLAAKAVGETGYVIGVDFTPDMIKKSRENISKRNYKNVSFRLGEIEYLPVADTTVDVVISNCVINLVPNKLQVFNEVFRVLKSGGRVSISDVVTSVELPESVKNDLKLFAGCLSGATLISEMEDILKVTGFVDIRITPKEESKEFIKNWAPGCKLEDFVKSAIIEARKP